MSCSPFLPPGLPSHFSLVLLSVSPSCAAQRPPKLYNICHLWRVWHTSLLVLCEVHNKLIFVVAQSNCEIATYLSWDRKSRQVWVLSGAWVTRSWMGYLEFSACKHLLQKSKYVTWSVNASGWKQPGKHSWNWYLGNRFSPVCLGGTSRQTVMHGWALMYLCRQKMLFKLILRGPL